MFPRFRWQETAQGDTEEGTRNKRIRRALRGRTGQKHQRERVLSETSRDTPAHKRCTFTCGIKVCGWAREEAKQAQCECECVCICRASRCVQRTALTLRRPSRRPTLLRVAAWRNSRRRSGSAPDIRTVILESNTLCTHGTPHVRVLATSLCRTAARTVLLPCPDQLGVQTLWQ